MATAPDQTNEQVKEAVERRWHRKQKRRVMILHRPTGSNRNQSYQPPILPHRTGRAESHPWVSMVCCRTTKNRLETRMDRSHTASSNTASQQCKESYLCTPTKKHPPNREEKQLLPRKDHLPSKENPCSTRWRYPLQIPKTQESV